MKSLKTSILSIKRILFLLILVQLIGGCVYISPKMVKPMSDGSICEYLGPAWDGTPEEKSIIRNEAIRREILCAKGQIVEKVNSPRTHKAKTATGFAVSSNGLLVTAYHVVEGAKEIHVKFIDKDWIPATLYRYSLNTDIAILKIANTTPSCLSLKPTTTLKAGDPVFTIGFPVVDLIEHEAKHTDGNFSSLSGGNIRSISGIKWEDWLMQINVPIQPGNSGGPLVASNGYVFGLVISTAAMKGYDDITETLPQNISWAVKSDYILPLLRDNEVTPSKTKVDNHVQMVSKAICLVKAE